MNNFSITALTACLVLLLAAPALAQGQPAATKSGGTVVSAPDTVVLSPGPPGSPAPMPQMGGTKKPGRVTPIKVVVKTYKGSRDEALTKLTRLIKKPPKDPIAARGQLVVIMDAPQQHLITLNKVVIKRRNQGGGTGLKGFDLEAEREYMEKLYKLAAQALELQIQMIKTRTVMQKAIEDTPQLIKALAEELKAVQDKAKDYLKGVGERIDARERQLAEMKKVVEREREKLRRDGEAKLKKAMAEHKYQKSLLARVEREMASVRQATMTQSQRDRRVRELQVQRGKASGQVHRAQVAVAQTKVHVDGGLAKVNARLSRVDQQLAQAGQKVSRWMDQRRKDQESAERFIATVSGNVQHVWENLLKAGQEILEQKQHQPATHKKRVGVIGVQAQQIAGADNAPHKIKLTAGLIHVQLKKSQVHTSKVVIRATAIRKPLETGQAVHGISIFKGVKPSEITARAKQAFIDLVKKKKKATGQGRRPLRQNKRNW